MALALPKDDEIAALQNLQEALTLAGVGEDLWKTMCANLGLSGPVLLRDVCNIEFSEWSKTVAAQGSA